MAIKTQSWLTRVVVCAAILTPMSALADLQIQSAQYKAEKNVLYVKGKLTGNSVDQVYVVDAHSKRPLAGSGAIDTYARGRQFNAEIQISAFTPVPCMVQVQTKRPGGFFSRFFGGGSQGFGPAPGDFSVAEVRHAPEACDEQ